MGNLFCGVDFHKRTCTIFVVDSDGKQIGSTKRVSTDRLLIEIANLRDVVVGIVGAFVAGLLFPKLGFSLGAGIVGQIISAAIGACILLFVIRLVKRA